MFDMIRKFETYRKVGLTVWAYELTMVAFDMLIKIRFSGKCLITMWAIKSYRECLLACGWNCFILYNLCCCLPPPPSSLSHQLQPKVECCCCHHHNMHVLVVGC